MDSNVSLRNVRMKKEIEEFKRDNGNSSFSTKELVMYAIHRIDAVDGKIGSGEGKIAENRTKIDGHIKEHDKIEKKREFTLTKIGLMIGGSGVLCTIITIIITHYKG